MRKINALSIAASLLLIFIGSVLMTRVGYAEDTGFLVAKGHGLVTFTGNGPLTISGDGSLVVNKNCTVILPENAANSDGVEYYIRKNAGIVYPNISGKVQIDGKDIEISFAGANMGVRVEGEGTIVLEGYGIYIDNTGNTGRWSADGTTVPIKK